LAIIVISLAWFAASLLYIIPHFRGGNHFALDYYGDFGDSPFQIFLGILENPLSVLKYLFRWDTITYFIQLLLPFGFMSLLSPIHLFIALPEFGINLLSNNWYMRNITLHYSSVIQPFVFISAMYGINRLYKKYGQRFSPRLLNMIPLMLLILSIVTAYWYGPLPYARKMDTYVLNNPQGQYKEAKQWSGLLDDQVKLSSTDSLSPLFSGRRYFYMFSENYYLADYVVVRPHDIDTGADYLDLPTAYEALQNDSRFTLLYNNENLKVYKKL
jgi:uncharacterized membrane protein